MTMGHAAKWVLWLRNTIIDMGFGDWVKRPTLMIGDNRNARDHAIGHSIEEQKKRLYKQIAVFTAHNKTLYLALAQAAPDAVKDAVDMVILPNTT